MNLIAHHTKILGTTPLANLLRVMEAVSIFLSDNWEKLRAIAIRIQGQNSKSAIFRTV